MSSPQTVLITGCSSGFGRVSAFHLAHLGWQVFATVRKEEDQASLQAEAERLQCQTRLIPLLCDITDQAQVAHLSESITQQAGRLNALVNNAGTVFAAPIELLDLEDLRQQFELNVIAQIGVIQACLPLLRKGRGTIVNISSISGRYAAPVLGPYAASKYALEALSDALRVELAPFHIRVVLLEPGSAQTQIWSTSRLRASKVQTSPGHELYTPLLARTEELATRAEKHGFAPEILAETLVKILTNPHPRSRYILPARERWIIFLHTWLPTWIWDRQVRRLLRW